MIETIIHAIENRLEIEFTYSGIYRVGQPAAVGISRAGNEVLRIYQTEGGHVHPNHEWDLCLISDLSGITVTDTHFGENPPFYKSGDKSMTIIYAEL